jgi:hypothetical protein
MHYYLHIDLQRHDDTLCPTLAWSYAQRLLLLCVPQPRLFAPALLLSCKSFSHAAARCETFLFVRGIERGGGYCQSP